MTPDLLPDQVRNRVIVTDAGCWEWTGCLVDGYGRIQINHRRVLTHRLAYELLVGPIPEGLVIDHLCRVRACCSPEHLEPVTVRENNLRGFGVSALHARKTHCPQGHPYDEANTYRENRADGTRPRRCRACRANEARIKRARTIKENV